MSKFGEVFFALVLLFIGWIFMADTGQQKLNRACRPMSWMGNMFTSTAEMSFPTTSTGVQDWFGRFDYGCQYMLWRLFYEDSYKAHLAVNGGAPGAQAIPGQQPGNAYPPGYVPQSSTAPAPPGVVSAPIDPRRPVPPAPAPQAQPGAYVPAPQAPQQLQQNYQQVAPGNNNYTPAPQDPGSGFADEEDDAE